MSVIMETITSLVTRAEDVRPGATILDGDGERVRTVRDVKYGCCTVVFVYTSGPSDVFRRNYPIDVIG